jgi:membrane-associated PAP2 superfamily phosphatase
MAQNKRPAIFIPLLITIVLTLLALVFNLDIRISNLFFHAESSSWLFKNTLVEKLVYDLSPVPAFILFSIGVIIALGSIWKKQWRRWTRGAIFWILVMVLGPGLVVNAVFKDFYGRPRPKQVIEYSGKMEFCPVWVPGEPGKGKSFPCGHASIGFYFMAGYFYWWRKNRWRARRWLASGLVAGSVIGLARMAVGAHWFSDVVWAGAFTYFISYLLAAVCGLLKAPAMCEENP